MQNLSNDIILVIIITLFVLVITACIVIFVILYQKRHQVFLQEKSAFQQMLLQSQLEIQEQTLHKVSQEIHDNIGQVLSLVKLNLATLNYQAPLLAQQKAEQTKELVSKAIHDLRNLSKSMNTSYINELGLLRSIDYELSLIRNSGVYLTELLIDGDPPRVEAEKELILFRIVQEVLNNILKHAQADTITIKLTHTSQCLQLTITDNGQGFDTLLLKHKEIRTFGLGIKNMHNRATVIGADFSITSIPGKGTTVTILLPVTS